MEKEKKKGKIKWIIIAVIAFAVIVAVAGGSGDSEVKQVNSKTSELSDKKGDNKEQKDTEKTEFNVGDIAEYNDVQVSFTKLVKSKGDGEFVKPDDGNVFVLCSFEINNKSTKDISISSIACFEAYCDDLSMNEDLMGLQVPEAKGQKQLDGDIASGKKMQGVIAYQVPKNWKKLEIRVKPGFWSSKDIKFVAKNK